MASEREMVLRGGGETPWHALRQLALEMHALSKSDPARAPDQAVGKEIRTRMFHVPKGGPTGQLGGLIPDATWVVEAKWVVAG